MITSEEQQKINGYSALGKNWGYHLEMTPLAIFENYLIRRSVVIADNPANSYIPIITPAKDFDSRDYLYVKNALVRQEKEHELLELCLQSRKYQKIDKITNEQRIHWTEIEYQIKELEEELK